MVREDRPGERSLEVVQVEQSECGTCAAAELLDHDVDCLAGPGDDTGARLHARLAVVVEQHVCVRVRQYEAAIIGRCGRILDLDHTGELLDPLGVALGQLYVHGILLRTLGATPTVPRRRTLGASEHRRTLREVPSVLEPPALARLVDFAERPRTHDWSLRAALVRYAQPEPQRVNDILELVRRVDWALGQQTTVLAKQGQALWDALEGGAAFDGDAQLLGVLRAAQALDGLGDGLATWAVDRVGTRPDDEVDSVVEEVAQQLDALGVPHEERTPPPRGRA